MSANIRFEDWEAQQMQDPEFRAAAEALEPAYQVALLRMRQGLTQKELAERVGTKQPSIARLESGKAEPRLSFLRRVVEALGGELEVNIRMKDEPAPRALVPEQSSDHSGPTTLSDEESNPVRYRPGVGDLAGVSQWSDCTPAQTD